MTAGYAELFLDQGATFNHTITLADDRTNTPINIAGYSIYSQMRKSYYSQNASANIVCTITDAANGDIQLYLSAANTSNLQPIRYVWDVFTVDGSGVVEKVVDGVIHVNPRATVIS